MSIVQSLKSKDSRIEASFANSVDGYFAKIVDHQSEAIIRCTQSEDHNTPVLRDFHRQGNIFYLSGVDQKIHWSVSIEPTNEGLAFDYACRVSQFSLEKPIASRFHGSGFEVTASAVGDSPSLVITDQYGITVSPQNQDVEKVPYTVRYYFEVTPAS